MIEQLFDIIQSRKKDMPKESYTRQLLEAGEDRILRKIGEESLEVILASKSEGNQRLVEEISDLIYHLLVLLAFKGLTLSDINAELEKRHQTTK
jgi:phosphoribosyl-ATP pyrophosphohydrolase